MRIRKKTLTIVGLSVMVLMAVMITITYFVVTERFARLEAKELETQLHRVQNELSATLANLEATAADWAPWDDTYQFIQGANPTYAQNNLVESTFTNLRLNFMLFFDKQGRLVYGGFPSPDPGQTQFDKEALIDAVKTQAQPSLLLHLHEKSRISGILMVGPSPFLVSSLPIVTSNYKGPIRGTLVLGRILNAEEIKRIGTVTQSDLAVREPTSTKLRLPAATVLRALEETKEVFTIPLSMQAIAGYCLVRDLSGEPALILEVTGNRDIYAYGLATWRQNAIAIFTLGLFFIVLLMFVLDRAILNRLGDLARKVNTLAGTANCIKRLDIHATDEIGQVAGSINTMLDALQHYNALQMESELQYRALLEENERFLRELLDSISCGIMVVDAETRRVVDLNAAGAALLQTGRDEIIGQLCQRFMCVDQEEGCPVIDLNHTVELSPRELLKADGTRVPVLKTVVRIERKGHACLVESFMDISNLKKVEADLRLSEARYRRFFEEDITGDSLTEVDGGIIDCNRAFARIFGFEHADQVKGLNMETFYSCAADRQTMLERLCKEGKLEGIDLELLHRSGRPIYCIGNLIGHFDHDHELTQVSAYLFDDTKRVMLEKDLRQAHKLEAIGTLAGGIAHDFNNILSGIMGYTEIALTELPEGSPTAGKLNKALDAIYRAKELVQQILAFSRQSESDPRPIKLSPIIKEVLKLMRASLPATIDIRQALEVNATVVADPVQIHQVVMNLCTNAAHAMKIKGGTLTVSMRQELLTECFTDRYPEMSPGFFVCISVEDNGDGIPPAVMGRIFDPFFTTKSKTEGTGLGLSVVHGIVSKLGGGIQAISIDKGSRFDVFLPCAAAADEHPIETSDTVPAGSETIVFIDDEVSQVDVGTQMLSALGYRVTGFTDSREALDFLTANAASIDLVVTDMTMPHLTGSALADRLLAMAPHLPIIICSGFSEAITPEKALSMGIRAFMSKPVRLADLARKVREVLDGDAAKGPST
jgi:two-component system cell cycle sensor histidine kinase/response regulator CckA